MLKLSTFTNESTELSVLRIENRCKRHSQLGKQLWVYLKTIKLRFLIFFFSSIFREDDLNILLPLAENLVLRNLIFNLFEAPLNALLYSKPDLRAAFTDGGGLPGVTCIFMVDNRALLTSDLPEQVPPLL